MKTSYPRNAQPGDFVEGAIAQMTSRGRMGWGTKTHIAKVDHRYGPYKSLMHVIALCGRRGRREVGSRYNPDRCKACERIARKQGIEWR